MYLSEHPREVRQFCRTGFLLLPLSEFQDRTQDVLSHDKSILPLRYLANEAKSFVLHCVYQTS